MMDWTDRHCRVFHRAMSRHTRLYSEMVTADAVLRGDRERLIGFTSCEHPVALQLGGSDPAKLAEATRIGADFGYDEINLNIGCPSDRVQEGRFGACLMAEPGLVARCVSAMQSAAAVLVTVKCRIGIDDQDSERDFQNFIDTVADAGCSVFIVHARKALLRGLSPKENRDVPPLNYERVYRLKSKRPDLTIVINGGITSLDACDHHLNYVDGVMIGRAAYQDPYLLAAVDERYFGASAVSLSRSQAIAALLPYVTQHVANGGRLSNVTRHVLGLYHQQPRGRLFRRYLSENAVKPEAAADVLIAATAIAEGLRAFATHGDDVDMTAAL